MGSFTNLSDVINRLSGGNSGAPEHIFFWKDGRVGAAAATTPTAGFPMSLWQQNGIPSHGAAPGQVAIPVNTTAGGLQQTDPAGGRQKYLLGIEGQSSSIGTLVLYDRILHNSGLDGTLTTNQGVQGNASSQTVTSISNGANALVTKAAHGLSIGQKIQFTTNGTLPTGLSLLTDYYIIATGFTSGAFEVSATYGGSAVTTSSNGSGTHTVTGTVQQALTRYATGAGNFAFAEIYSALGATATTITMSYTNQAGVSGQTSQTAAIGSSTNGQNSAQRIIPIPLASGDTGIQAIDKVALAASTLTAGSFGITVGHMYGAVSMGAANALVLRDMIAGYPSLLEVLTDACIAMLWYPNAASVAQIFGGAHFAEI